MYHHQHGESEKNPSDDHEAVFNQKLVDSIRDYLEGQRNEKQPSGDRHSRPLQDHNDGEQPSGDRHSRLLEGPKGGEQPSGDKSSESEAGK